MLVSITYQYVQNYAIPLAQLGSYAYQYAQTHHWSHRHECFCLLR